MAPIDYVAIANRKFSEVGRSVIPYASKSTGYFKDYTPIKSAYENKIQSRYNSIDSRCYNC